MQSSRSDLERWSRRGRLEKLERAMAVRTRDLSRGVGGATLDVGAERRRYAVQLLSEHVGARTEAALRRGLDDPSPTVRLQALRGLATQSNLADPDMLAVGLELPDEEMREAAASVIEHAAVPDAERATRLLLAYVAGDAVPAVTFDGAWVEALWRTVGSDSRSMVASQAAQTLEGSEHHARAQQLAEHQHQLVEDAILARIGKPESQIRAIELLGRLRAVAAVEPLVRHLAEGDPAVRAAAAAALGRIRHPAAIGPLMRASADEEPTVRDASIDAVDRFGSAGTVWGVLAAANGGSTLDTNALAVAAQPPGIEPIPVPATPPQPQPRPAPQRRSERARKRLRRVIG